MQQNDIEAVSQHRNGHRQEAAEAKPDGRCDQERESPEAVNDPVVRPRFKYGSTRTRRFAYDEPLPDKHRLEETPLTGLLGILSSVSPATASVLHWYYNHVLQQERRELLRLRAEEETKRQAAAERARQHNAKISADQDLARQAAESDLAAIRSEVGQAEKYIHEAHLAAAAPAAQTGGVYDPDHPESACLRHEPQPLEVVMGRVNMPWVAADSQMHLPGWLAWSVTILVGAMIGVSIGILSHSLHADSLDRELGRTVGWALGGFAIAVGFKYTSRYAWYVVGQYVYCQFRQRRWLPAIVTALLVTASFIVADALTNLQGLLAMASQDAALNDLSGGSSAAPAIPVPLYFVSFVVSSGFIASACYEGYLRGRRSQVQNLALVVQHDEYTARDQQVRSDPKVLEALTEANRARVHTHHKVSLETAATRRENRRDRAVDDLDKQRVPSCDELTESAAFRIQDQRDNVQGAMQTWNRLLFSLSRRWLRRRFRRL